MYIMRFCDRGEFTLTLPLNSRFANIVQPECWLLVDYKYWLIVEDIETSLSANGGEVIARGTDFKGLLNWYITLYYQRQDIGTEGYDVVKGSSETVVKHYIKNNIANPRDANRQIVGFTVAQDKKRGLENDSYMSRFENVAELVKKVCTNAKIGYDITVDEKTNQIIFDIVEPRDLTESQSENNRVVFAVDRGNVNGMIRAKGVSAYKNAFYTTKSGGGLDRDALTQLVYRENELPKGIRRREFHLNVSVTEDEAGQGINDLIALARKEAVNYVPIDSYDCDIKGTYRLGKDYSLGDYVTVKNEILGTEDKQITEATVEYSRHGEKLSLVMGDKSKKPFNYMKNLINNKGV